MPPFHLAFPTKDLNATRAFMLDVLEAGLGRESDRWVDFNFFGHQITAHLVDDGKEMATNPVDGKSIPAFHFGVVLSWNDWEALADRMRAYRIGFLVEPYVRFKGETGEQGTFFVKDPGGAALEFKTFKDMDQLFAR